MTWFLQERFVPEDGKTIHGHTPQHMACRLWQLFCLQWFLKCRDPVTKSVILHLPSNTGISVGYAHCICSSLIIECIPFDLRRRCAFIVLGYSFGVLSLYSTRKSLSHPIDSFRKKCKLNHPCRTTRTHTHTHTHRTYRIASNTTTSTILLLLQTARGGSTE